MLTDNFEPASEILAGIQPVEKLSNGITTSVEGGKTWKGKTFAQLQDENPAALEALEKENPDAFNELFKESYK